MKTKIAVVLALLLMFVVVPVAAAPSEPIDQAPPVCLISINTLEGVPQVALQVPKGCIPQGNHFEVVFAYAGGDVDWAIGPFDWQDDGEGYLWTVVPLAFEPGTAVALAGYQNPPTITAYGYFGLPDVPSDIIEFYPIELAQRLEDPSVFDAWMPNELMVPMRIDGASGGTRENPLREVFPGPLDWHPAFPTGWGTTLDFQQVPEVVSIAVVAIDPMDKALRLGYGHWETPVPAPPTWNIFLPLITR